VNDDYEKGIMKEKKREKGEKIGVRPLKRKWKQEREGIGAIYRIQRG
jgi:hypothetical protein